MVYILQKHKCYLSEQSMPWHEKMGSEWADVYYLIHFDGKLLESESENKVAIIKWINR